MGSGKGTPELWVARVKPGRLIFEIDGNFLLGLDAGVHGALGVVPGLFHFAGARLVFLGDGALLVGGQFGLGKLLVHGLPQRAGRAGVGVEGVVGGEPVILQCLGGRGERVALRLLP